MMVCVNKVVILVTLISVKSDGKKAVTGEATPGVEGTATFNGSSTQSLDGVTKSPDEEEMHTKHNTTSEYNCIGVDSRKNNPKVSITVNAIGSVSLMGKVTVRNLIMNWEKTQENVTSVSTAPPNMAAKVNPKTVTTGIRAFLKAWTASTRRSGIPRALAAST